MKKSTLIFSLLFLFVAGVVHAHGPVRAKMTATVVINAPADKVWDVIKNFDDISWHPGIANSNGSGGNNKKATRVLTFKDGGSVTEELKKYDAKKMSIKYKIIDISTLKTIQHSGQEEIVPVLPVNNYAATISVKAKGGKSEVKWVATYYRAYLNNNPPPELNEDAADEAVTNVLTSGLTALLQKFDASGSESAVTIKIKR